MRIRVPLFLAALIAPIATFASNHNADNQSVIDVEVMRRGLHVYVITYTAGTHLYADETRSGGAGRIQCTWNLNATLSRTLEIDNKPVGAPVEFRATALPPGGGIATEKGKSCDRFKSEPAINQQVDARLTKPFWDSQIQDDMKTLRQQYKFRPIAASATRSSTAYRRTPETRPLHRFAMTCFRTKDAVCKYQFIKLVARSWIIAPRTPVPGIAAQLTDADRAQLAAYIDQIGSTAKEDPAIDKIVDKILDKLKDKALEAIGISASTVSNWTLAGEILTTGAPNGTVSEDKLIELSRDTDAQLDAEEARTDAFIATLSTIAATSPNASVKASSAVLLNAYCQALKSAITAERQRRATSANGGASAAAAATSGHNDGPANSLPGAGGGRARRIPLRPNRRPYRLARHPHRRFRYPRRSRRPRWPQRPLLPRQFRCRSAAAASPRRATTVPAAGGLLVRTARGSAAVSRATSGQWRRPSPDRKRRRQNARRAAAVYRSARSQSVRPIDGCSSKANVERQRSRVTRWSHSAI